ncbi:MAG: hypothetical protein LKE40_01455 [Spirochaetia bacterium]|jgi:hypothetical protein|nr:hypothetical protein [Spirochaetia bacterium]
MIGFFIKKAFFDAWDNLIGLVLSNLGFLACLLGLLGSFTLFGHSTLLGLICMVLCVGLLSFHAIGISSVVEAYGDYKRVGWAGYKKSFRLYWRHAFLLWGVLLAMLLMLVVVMPFYLHVGNWIGLMLAVIIFWVFLTLLLSLPYYLPLMIRFSGDRPLKTLKKCFLVAIGNTGVSFFLLVFNLIQVVLGVLTVGLLFSGCGIMLASQDAFKLLMYKLDYLEENPDTKAKAIPWDDILYEEKENVGHRSLKGMIFPWKD